MSPSSITIEWAFRLAKQIRNKVKRLRFEAGEMSQQGLADRVGVTRQTIIAIEKDKYSPSLEVAFKISEVFEVDLACVFSYS